MQQLSHRVVTFKCLIPRDDKVQLWAAWWAWESRHNDFPIWKMELDKVHCFFIFFFLKIRILLVFHISWNVGGSEVRRWDALSETSGPRREENQLFTHSFAVTELTGQCLRPEDVMGTSWWTASEFCVRPHQCFLKSVFWSIWRNGIA